MQPQTLLVLTSGLLLIHLSDAAAVQRKHKPWFSSDSSPRQVVSQSPVSENKNAEPQPTVRRGDGRDKGVKIAQQAVAYKGTRYRFGGTTPKGLDCSGLINRVWEDLQLNKIPRVSSALYRKGEPVKLSELKPGDLVFFKNTYRRGVSHVGVYTGKNKFVHASPRRGVTLTKLSDPYYQLHYAGARRLY